MVIAFLQGQKDPILPNIFDKINDKKSETFYCLSNMPKYKKTNVTKVETKLNDDVMKQFKNFTTKNQKSVGQLVIEFMQFYFLSPDKTVPQIDITKGGYSDIDPDQRPLFDIVEPLTNTVRVAQGCHKDSLHSDSYKKFAYGFCMNVIENA